jgi:hypothetical protein
MVSCCQRVLNGGGEQVPFWHLYECEEDGGELIHVRDSKNCVFFYPANDTAVSILLLCHTWRPSKFSCANIAFLRAASALSRAFLTGGVFILI